MSIQWTIITASGSCIVVLVTTNMSFNPFFVQSRYITGFQYIVSMAPEETEELLEYFRKTWTGSRTQIVESEPVEGSLKINFKMTTELTTTPAIFPIAQWNVHEATLADRHRTNNICEGFNNGFSASVPSAHPVLWKVNFKYSLLLAR